MVEVLADEDELVGAALVGLPILLPIAVEDHVDRLVHEALVRVGDVQHALHPEDVGTLGLQDLRDPRLHEVEVDLSVVGDARRRDGRVVLVLAVGVEKLGVHLQSALQVEAANVEDVLDGDVGHVRALDRCERVDRLNPRLDAHQILLAHEVRLVEQDPVSERDLLDRLVLSALRLLLVEVLLDVLGVDQRDDAVKLGESLDRIVDEKGLRDGGRVGHAGRLDDDAVELELARCLPLRELVEDNDQVLTDGAADAAVHHLDDLLVGLHLGVLLQQLVIDANLAEFILDDGNLLAVRRGEDVVEQGGLAGAQEAREDGDRNAIVRGHDCERVGFWMGSWRRVRF
mmetsp:Transcript_62323/g.165422  ORF Transcript_62323/g.165422 Transcript_62323/m.165422 type:complete len:343 (+) Transcript_62323:523-1551(+)